MQAKQKHTRAKPTEKQTSKKHMAFCIVTCFDFLSEKQIWTKCLVCCAHAIHQTNDKRSSKTQTICKQASLFLVAMFDRPQAKPSQSKLLPMQAKQEHIRAKPTDKQTSKKHMAFCIVTCFDFLNEMQILTKCLVCCAHAIHQTNDKQARNKRSANKQVCFWLLGFIHRMAFCYAQFKQSQAKPSQSKLR